MLINPNSMDSNNVLSLVNCVKNPNDLKTLFSYLIPNFQNDESNKSILIQIIDVIKLGKIVNDTVIYYTLIGY